MRSLPAAATGLDSDPKGSAQHVPVDPAFGNGTAIDEHDRNPEVVQGKELGLAVHVALSRLDPKLADGYQGLVAEVAPAPRDQVYLHDGQQVTRS
jgi:hypothetical protein